MQDMTEAKSPLNVIFSRAKMNVDRTKKMRNTETTARSLYALSFVFSPKEIKVRCNVKK